MQAVRRVVEIRDGTLAVAPSGSRDVLGADERQAVAAGPGREDAWATGEAAWLRAAAAAKRAGRPGRRGGALDIDGRHL